MDKGLQKKHPPGSVAINELIKLEVLERLCRIGQGALSAELDELHEAMDRDYETLENPNDEDAYLGHINDEYIEVSETLPCLHWYAQFLIAYSFFERSLNAFVYSFASRKQLSESLARCSGQSVG